MLALIAAAALGGCTIVEVRAEGAPPRLSAWPLGVRVDRGANGAVSVNSQSVGPYAGCGVVGLGYQHCDQIAVDPASCGVAIIEKPATSDRSVLARISDQSRATCLRQPESKP